MRLPIAGGLLVLVACQQPGDDPLSATTTSALPTHTAPLRFVEVVEGAHFIRTGLPDKPTDEHALAEDFEGPDWSAWTVRKSSNPRASEPIVELGEGSEGKAIAISGGEHSMILPKLTQEVKVKGRTTYRLTGLIRAEALEPRGSQSAGATFELIEKSGGKDARKLVHHDHLLRERGTTDGWREFSYTFRTRKKTRSIDLQLVAARGVTTGKVLFDSIRLTRVPVTERIATLRPVPRPPRTAPDHPLVRKVVINRDERPAIVGMTPSMWGASLNITEPSRLDFAIGRAPQTSSSTELCFEVRWSGDSKSLYENCLTDDENRNWTDVSVPLEPLSGRSLIFKTQSNGDAIAVGVWGNPRIVPAERAAEDARPNIALIVFDTLRVDHLGVEGYTRRATSPNLDAFANASVRFSRAYAASGWTAPSLASLVTSHYPSVHRAGIRVPRERYSTRATKSLQHKNELGYLGLSSDEVTLATRLATSGYDTAGFYSNYFFGAELGFARGFDRYHTYQSNNLDGGNNGTELARKWLEDHAKQPSQPFFMVAHFVDPHMPYRRRNSQEEAFPIPETLTVLQPEGNNDGMIFTEFTKESLKQLDDLKVVYDAEISWMDQAVGELLDSLSKHPNTVILATADHGEAFGEHGRIIHGNALYEELVHVPLYLQLPEGRHAGTVVDTPVSLLDVTPTLLELAEVDPPEGMEGRPLLPLEDVGLPKGGLIMESIYEGPDMTAIFDGQYKYIFTHPRGYLGQQTHAGNWKRVPLHEPIEELYDVVADPLEKNNLVTDQRERADEMRSGVLSHIANKAHGVHIRCAPEGTRDLRVHVQTADTMTQVQPLQLRDSDSFDLAKTRQAFDLTLTDGSIGWLVIRQQRPGGIELQIQADEADGKDASATPQSWAPGEGTTTPPETVTPGSCEIWGVGQDSIEQSNEIDDETQKMLEAMGYME